MRVGRGIASARGAELWKTIQQIEPFAAYERYDEPLEYWADLSFQFSPVFWEVFREGADLDALAYLVDQFGRHGAEMDLRWLLVEPTVLLAQRSDEPPGFTTGENPDLRDYVERVTALQLEVCKLQVERWLQDRDGLERYYNAVVWSGAYLGHGRLQHATLGKKARALAESFIKHEPNDLFWWRARDFMLLAHATSRDDTWRNATSEELPTRCQKWLDWLWLNRYYLEPDSTAAVWRLPAPSQRTYHEGGIEPLTKPNTPFPDYSGPMIEHPVTIFAEIRLGNPLWMGKKGTLLMGDRDTPLREWIDERRRSLSRKRPTGK